MKKEKTKSMSRLAKCLLACLFACGTAGLGVALALSSVTVEMKGGYNWERIPSASEYTMLKFVYNDTDKTASVSSAVDENGNKIASGAIVIPGKVSNNGKVYTVTTISASAFKISENDEGTSGEGCPITSVEISEGVTTIESTAFQFCSSLASVKIPVSVTSIYTNSFSDTSSLTTISVDSNNATYSVYDHAIYENTILFHGTKAMSTIKSGTTVIGYASFEGTGISSISIPSTIKTIENYAFNRCGSLTSVIISEGCTSLGKYSFKNCSSLESVSIPASMETIGVNAFLNSGLTEANFADGKDWMAGDKFLDNANVGSSSVAAYYLKDNTFTYKDLEWKHIPYESALSSYLTFDLSNKTVSAKVSKADAGTNFNGGNYHYQESTLFIPSRVRDSSGSIYTITSIPDASFQGCSGVSEIVFPDTLKSVGSGAFYTFNSITKLNIPASVTSLASDNPFMGMRGLNSIIVAEGNSKYSSYNDAIYENTTLISGSKNTSKIKSGTRIIGCQAFRNTAAAGVTLPTSVVKIEDCAFMESNCQVIIFNVQDGTNPELSTIGQKAFHNSAFKTTKFWTSEGIIYEDGLVSLSYSLRVIGYQAFYGCSGITDVEIGSSVQYIYKQAFQGTSLTSATFASTSNWYVYNGIAATEPYGSSILYLSYPSIAAQLLTGTTFTHPTTGATHDSSSRNNITSDWATK